MPPTRVLPAQSSEQVAGALEAFLGEFSGSVVLEDGKVLFDMREAKYTLSTEHGRCTLHLWGEQRNLVRRVVGAELRAKTLRLSVMKFGHAKATLLEVVADRGSGGLGDGRIEQVHDRRDDHDDEAQPGRAVDRSRGGAGRGVSESGS